MRQFRITVVCFPKSSLVFKPNNSTKKGLGALFVSAPKPENTLYYAIDVSLFSFNN
jgi:hypothetical protein